MCIRDRCYYLDYVYLGIWYNLCIHLWSAGEKSLSINLTAWRDRKLKFWNRMWEDLEIGYLDEDLLPILIEFFLRPYSHTLSSCSGRITLADSLKPWSRDETGIVFKKHVAISLDNILHVLDKPVIRRLWFIVAGPIIHVSTARVGEAKKILRIAQKAGFKHSGILSVNRLKGILLELRTGIRMTHLLAIRNKLLIDEDDLKILINIANELLLDGKHRLERLYRELRENRPPVLDQDIVEYLDKKALYMKFLERHS